MAVRKINLRGVIVGAEYDIDWLKSYIERGLFTPESAIRREFDQAAKDGDDVELYVNSQGGSVFAAGEIINRIKDFAGKVTIKVGAFAASAAANIVLQAKQTGRAVEAHANSIFLYHGAWGVALGGKDAMQDTAKILQMINAPIMAALEQFGVPKDEIEEGFAEGRELTMDAEEAAIYGIVDSIIIGNAPLLAKMSKEDEEEILKQDSTLDVAACAAWQAQNESGEGAGEGAGEGTGEGTGENETVEARAARLEVALAKATAENRALQSAADKRVAALQAKLDAQAQEATELRTSMEKAANEAAKKILTLTKERDTAVEAHAKLTGAALLASAEPTISSWPDAAKKYGLIEASKRFPELAQAYRKLRAK